MQLGVPVSINIENGIAAMALAQISGVTPEEISGVWLRSEEWTAVSTSG